MKPAYHSITALENVRILQAPEPVATLDFLRGAVIQTGLNPPWDFDVEIDSVQPPHLLGGRTPMASERLLTVLSDAGADNIQTFQARLQLRGGREWRQHCVFNVVGLLDAADLSASGGAILAERDGRATRIEFRNLVLSRAYTMGLSVFRLFHDPAMLLVDDRILHALNKHRPVEGWGFSAIEVELRDPPEPT
jgi:hypothetical protein